MTLACEDANSKLVEVVTVADVDTEDQTLSTRVGQDFKVEVQARFLSWSLFNVQLADADVL